MTRLQKLVESEGLDGLIDLTLEAPCFQLDNRGEVCRHLFIGLTERELLMATQQIPNCRNLPDAVLNPDVDLELEGLQLNCIVPLDRVKFYLVDDRSRKFAICSCIGEVRYFEQCNTPDGSDAIWTNWMEFISKQDSCRSFGYKHWSPNPDNSLAPNRRLEFIKRPYPFYGVESLGIQTSDHLSMYRFQNHPLKKFFKVSNFQSFHRHTFISYDTSITTDDFPDDNNVSSKNESLRPSKSMSDVNEGCHISQTVLKYSLFSLIYQALHCNKDTAMEWYLDYFPQWSSLSSIFRIYAQILRHQTRGVNSGSRFSSGSEVDSEASVSITDLVADYKVKHQTDPEPVEPLPSKKWGILKEKLLITKTRRLSALEQVVHDVVFQKCGSKIKKSNITVFTPNEFSTETMLITSELLMKITQTDFYQLHRKTTIVVRQSLLPYFVDRQIKQMMTTTKILIIDMMKHAKSEMPPTIKQLLDHFEGVSRIVADDVLHNTSLPRFRLILYYFKACSLCLSRGDYQSCQSILTGLLSPRVYSLSDDWNLAKKTARKEIRSLVKLTSMVFDKSNYIEHVAQQTSRTQIMLPLLDHLLQHVWGAPPAPNRFQKLRKYQLLMPKDHIMKASGSGFKLKFANLKTSASGLSYKSKKNSKKNFIKTASNVATTSQDSMSNKGSIGKAEKERSLKTANSNTEKSKTVVKSHNVKGASQGNGGKGEDEILLDQTQMAAQDFCDQIMKEALQIVLTESKEETNPRTTEKPTLKLLQNDDTVKQHTKENTGYAHKQNYVTGNDLKTNKSSKSSIHKQKGRTFSKMQNNIENRESIEEVSHEDQYGASKTMRNTDLKIQEKEVAPSQSKKSKDPQADLKRSNSSIGLTETHFDNNVPSTSNEKWQNSFNAELGTNLPSTSIDREHQTQSQLERLEQINTTKSLKNEEQLSDEEDRMDSMYFSTRYKQKIGTTRRKSLLEESVTSNSKDDQLDEVVNEKLTDFRKRSIFDDTYLDEPAKNTNDVKDLKEDTKSESKDNRRPSFFQSMFKTATGERRYSFLETLLFHDGEESVYSKLFSSNKTDASTTTSTASSPAPKSGDKTRTNRESIQRNKDKSVHFGDVTEIEHWEDSTVHNTTQNARNKTNSSPRVPIEVTSGENNNTNSNTNTKELCEHCGGKCIYKSDLFQEILKSQLLAITYINSHAGRPALRRLINERKKSK